jgi:hypothetical protein
LGSQSASRGHIANFAKALAGDGFVWLNRLGTRQRIDQPAQGRGVLRMGPAASAYNLGAMMDPLSRLLSIPVPGHCFIRRPADALVDMTHIGVRANGQGGQVVEFP